MAWSANAEWTGRDLQRARRVGNRQRAQYVEKHGRIIRREAAELCRIASHQARDLLARLSGRGELTMRGARRGAFYERGAKTLEESKTAPKGSKSGPQRGGRS